MDGDAPTNIKAAQAAARKQSHAEKEKKQQDFIAKWCTIADV
jgi:hypothetical protein